ncbi:3-oxoacyl-[acyl-carrier-protein] synthase III C-terminal domain-containing protein [Pseudomonas mangrovi]|uniref:3-oxoacyl-ACP synthase n=1 Tax=Pseudomonas mangrovi TaxID=2161748 RepID=A0A2T5PA14_9PSED|nr:3-oxoacyl-[acyl-carrier-protein] synthase III C-terminal domain-containing protein [Pseudomonas mangrovi]PTU74545.1 3-oxoacyl-ACP synthase [Pseudomonas mangrovi]
MLINASLQRRLALLGSGHALPQQRLSSAELDLRLGLATGTVERIGGVRSRAFANADETAASLAARAAQAALEAAGLNAAQLDCVVAASGTMDQGMPCNAALIHRELGLGASGIPAFDINASCLGFIAALDQLSWPLAAGRYQRVLLVCADIASCGLDWQQLESAAIFGDGAAAVVLGADGSGQGVRILASKLRTYSEGARFCQIPAGGSRHHPSRVAEGFLPLTHFAMQGKAVYRLASTHLPGFLEELLSDAQLHREQIDWVVPHQASRLAMDHLSRRLGFAADRVIDIFAEHGNQVAASLPTALDIARRDGRIQPGQRLLLLGTGAGLSLGGMLLELQG